MKQSFKFENVENRTMQSTTNILKLYSQKFETPNFMTETDISQSYGQTDFLCRFHWQIFGIKLKTSESLAFFQLISPFVTNYHWINMLRFFSMINPGQIKNYIHSNYIWYPNIYKFFHLKNLLRRHNAPNFKLRFYPWSWSCIIKERPGDPNTKIRK